MRFRGGGGRACPRVEPVDYSRGRGIEVRRASFAVQRTILMDSRVLYSDTAGQRVHQSVDVCVVPRRKSRNRWNSAVCKMPLSEVPDIVSGQRAHQSIYACVVRHILCPSVQRPGTRAAISLTLQRVRSIARQSLGILHNVSVGTPVAASWSACRVACPDCRHAVRAGQVSGSR